ncbi:MAG: response regulator, partial [Bacteroidota bacterium]
LHAIGVVYQKSGDYPLALDYFQQALDSLGENGNAYSQATTLNSIGNNFKKRGLHVEALPYFYRAVATWREIGPRKNIFYPLHNLGETYLKLGQLDSASYYLHQAEPITYGTSKNYQEAIVRTNLGRVFAAQGDLVQAEQYFSSAIEVAQSEGLKKEERDASWELYKLLKQQGRTAPALTYLERYQVLQDTLFNEESVRELTNLEAAYTFEREKTELTAKNEREKQALDAQVRRQRTWQFILGALLLIGGLGAYLYIRFQRFRQAAKLQLAQRQKQQLEEINAFRSRFFANISHELRTPLTLIVGPVRRLLRERGWKQEDHVQLQLIRDNANQLRARVEEILDLTRLEAGHIQLQETPTSLYSFCGRLLASFESYAQQKQQELTFEYLPSEHLSIQLDQGKFAHVLNNLLSNAIKFTQEGGAVGISIGLHESKPQRLVLSVKDNGPGIREAEIPQLFDRYYRSGGSDNKAGGSGIGLALSKEIAAAMNAELWVESQYGEGSTFYFEFPFREVLGVVKPDGGLALPPLSADVGALTKATKLVKAPVKPENTSQRPHILVVEDNRQLREYLKYILSEHFMVDVASNGARAWDMLSKNAYNLILSDIMMPEMDGYELLEKIKTSDEFRHLPVVMLTALNETKDKLNALRIGVDDYLLKPFVEEELLAHLQNLLARQRQRLDQQTTADNVTEASPPPELSAADLRWLEELEGLLKAEVGNPEFTMTAVEQKLFISRSQLQRRIKKITGLTPNKYFREIRLQVARDLLESGQVETVASLAAQVGFETAHYFSVIYEERFGRRPSEWLQVDGQRTLGYGEDS